MMETMKEIIQAAIKALEEQQSNIKNNSSIYQHEEELQSLQDYNNVLNVELSVLLIELPIVVIVITALIPIIIPSMVSTERILLLKILVMASFIFSNSIMPHLLRFVPFSLQPHPCSPDYQHCQLDCHRLG